MSIWDKVLVGLIVVVAAAFFYFGAHALRVHQYWGEKIEKLVGKDGKGGEIQRLADEKRKTLDSIVALQSDLLKLTAARGRVWFDCQPQPTKVDPATLSVSVLVPVKEAAQQPGVTESDPTGTEVFIFQDAAYDAEGKVAAPCVYLGEFSVKSVDKGQWNVQPSRGMNEAWLYQQRKARLEEAQQRLARKEPTTWTIYQILPKENIFQIAGQLAIETPGPGAKPPEGSPPEGSPAEQPPSEPASPAKPQPAGTEVAKAGPSGEASGLDTTIQRQAERLCDYEIVFNDFYRQMKTREEAIAQATGDLKSLTADQEAAAALVVRFKEQAAAVGQALTAQRAERKDVEDLAGRLDAKHRSLETGIAQTLAANQALAAEIAKLQFDAERRIRQQSQETVEAPAAP